MARLLSFSMPTMCVLNGTAIAGGYIFGLCHDFRIMNETVGEICLSELKITLGLPAAYMKVTSAKLTPRVCNKIVYAISVKQ